MKKLILGICFILVIFPQIHPQEQQSAAKKFQKITEKTGIKGPYLGQKPPGLTPEIFAPGIITTQSDEAYPSFTKTGTEFYFKCRDKGGWLFTHLVQGQWSHPRIIPFSNEYKFGEAMVTADGDTILFCTSYDSKESDSPENLDLWWMKKHKGLWQKPIKLGNEINTVCHEAYPSIAPSGDLYFFRDLEKEGEGCEVFVSRYQNDQYLPAENLGSKVNSSRHDCDPYISPDEKYLVFCVRDRTDGFGKNDLYVSFKKPDGGWAKSINMGNTFNTKAEEITPYVTPEGKYIFFASNRTGNYDIYWVDAKVIEELKPKSFPILKGPYLGQKPPGLTPKLFAPGIITTDISEGCSGWGKNMEYFIFQRWINRKSQLYIMYQNNGIWSSPQPVPFNDEYQTGDFTISPDGKTMVFASRILVDEIGSESEGANIWIVEKNDRDWTEPKPMGLRINTKYHESYPCVTSNGNLYFFSRRPGGYGDSDLYMSEFFEGKYKDPVNLGPKLNTQYHEWDTYTAPDESYMIFCSTKPDGLGDDDLYVTFKTADGSWSKPFHMGEEINSNKAENRPYVCPDGKYLFYTSTISGNRDIYWVDAKIIEKLKPEELK